MYACRPFKTCGKLPRDSELPRKPVEVGPGKKPFPCMLPSEARDVSRTDRSGGYWGCMGPCMLCMGPCGAPCRLCAWPACAWQETATPPISGAWHTKLLQQDNEAIHKRGWSSPKTVQGLRACVLVRLAYHQKVHGGCVRAVPALNEHSDLSAQQRSMPLTKHVLVRPRQGRDTHSVGLAFRFSCMDCMGAGISFTHLAPFFCAQCCCSHG